MGLAQRPQINTASMLEYVRASPNQEHQTRTPLSEPVFSERLHSETADMGHGETCTGKGAMGNSTREESRPHRASVASSHVPGLRLFREHP